MYDFVDTIVQGLVVTVCVVLFPVVIPLWLLGRLYQYIEKRTR